MDKQPIHKEYKNKTEREVNYKPVFSFKIQIHKLIKFFRKWKN